MQQGSYSYSFYILSDIIADVMLCIFWNVHKLPELFFFFFFFF